MYSLVSSLRKCTAEGREFTSGYTNRTKSHGGAGRNPIPDTSAMQHELTYFCQQVELLKNYRTGRRDRAGAHYTAGNGAGEEESGGASVKIRPVRRGAGFHTRSDGGLRRRRVFRYNGVREEGIILDRKRCRWADPNSELYIAYHDQEWGKPEHDDRKLFEMLLLEGFQAGLSWITILKKREAFRRAFDGFDPATVSQYGPEKLEALMSDPGIVRNRRKIEASVVNASVFLDIQREFGSFDRYLWGFTQGRVVLNTDDAVRASSDLSDHISADLRRRGMKFVGSVIIYSFLQAVGVVNDHETGCWLYPGSPLS